MTDMGRPAIATPDAATLIGRLYDVMGILADAGETTRKVVHRDERQQIQAVDEVKLGPQQLVDAGLAVLREIGAAIGEWERDDQSVAQAAAVGFYEAVLALDGRIVGGARVVLVKDTVAVVDGAARAIVANMAARRVRLQPPYAPGGRTAAARA